MNIEKDSKPLIIIKKLQSIRLTLLIELKEIRFENQ